MFGNTPYGKNRKIENVNQLVLTNVDFFFEKLFLHRGYFLFRQNAESSLEQLKKSFLKKSKNK